MKNDLLKTIFSRKTETASGNEDMILNAIIQEESDRKKIMERYGSCPDFLKRPAQAGTIRMLSRDGVDDPEGMPDCIVHKVQELIDSEEGLVFSDSSDQIVIMFFLDVLWEEQIHTIMEQIKKELKKTYPLADFVLTVGNLISDAYRFAASYRCAVGMQDYRHVKPRGKIIFYSDIIERRESYPKEIQFGFDILKEYLTGEDMEALSGYVSNIFGILSSKKNKVNGLVYNIAFEMIVNGLSFVRETGGNINDLVKEPENILYHILGMEDLKTIEQYVIDFLKKCSTYGK